MEKGGEELVRTRNCGRCFQSAAGREQVPSKAVRTIGKGGSTKRRGQLWSFTLFPAAAHLRVVAGSDGLKTAGRLVAATAEDTSWQQPRGEGKVWASLLEEHTTRTRAPDLGSEGTGGRRRTATTAPLGPLSEHPPAELRRHDWPGKVSWWYLVAVCPRWSGWSRSPGS